MTEFRLDGAPDSVCMLLEAVAFAASRHRNQRRKDLRSTPFINHPIDVARILLEVGQVRDTRVLVAALLHDTLEDTKTSENELSLRFGSQVCGWVKEVTDHEKMRKERRKQMQILAAPKLSEGARLIRLADKIANVQDLVVSPPQRWPARRCLEYVDWAEKVVRAMGTVQPDLNEMFEIAAARARDHWRASEQNRSEAP